MSTVNFVSFIDIKVQEVFLSVKIQQQAIDIALIVCYTFICEEAVVMERENKCGPLIKQISNEMQRNANNYMRAQGLTIVQFEALLELDCTPEKQLPLKELERRLHVAQSTTAGIVSRLEQKGFVEGLSDAGDKRVKVVRITPAGMKIIQLSEHNMIRAEDALLAGLTETERGIFLTLLKKICDSLR